MRRELHEIESKHTPQRIVLVGNPNVGKSAIFCALTGSYVIVSNYPGTTVEVAQGNMTINRRKVTVIDTPGANSLVPMSEDERVTRDILLSDEPSIIVQVADSKNLNRALILSSQLAEMELPFILVLNMEDEAGSRGIKTDTKALSKVLGVPVVATVATQREGLDDLVAALDKVAVSPFRVRLDTQIEDASHEIEALMTDIPRGRRAHALSVLSGDESLSPWLHERLPRQAIRKMEAIRSRIQAHSARPLTYAINLRRMRAVDRLARSVRTTEAQAIRRARKRTWLRRLHPLVALPLLIAAAYGVHVLLAVNPLFAMLALPLLLMTLYALGDWGTHPFYGIPILGIVIFLTWLFVGRFGAGTAADFLQHTIFGNYINPVFIWLSERLLPWSFARELFVGDYGIITMALTYSIGIILPIVGAFFIVFGMLEDSGYLPRLAVMVDRIFKAIGLSGKAVLPMVLGLGCGTMATLTARILDTRRERVIVTLLLALGVPCSAQLGVILGMLGAPGVPFAATAIWAGVLLIVMLKVGWLAGKLMPGHKSDFILEVPPIRLPRLGNISAKTFARAKWYIKEAVPLFVIGTLILFIADKLWLLIAIERITAPIIQGMLGLPAKATEAFIIGFLRRDYGVAGLYDLQQSGQLSTVQMIVGLVTVTLFVPCLANFLVIIKERGLKTAAAIVLFILPYAFLVGGLLNWILRITGAFK